MALTKGGIKTPGGVSRVYANYDAFYYKMYKEGMMSRTKYARANYKLVGYHPYSIISFYKILYKTFIIKF